MRMFKPSARPLDAATPHLLAMLLVATRGLANRP